MSDLNIIIKALLDEQQSARNINAQLEKIRKEVNDLKINIDIGDARNIVSQLRSVQGMQEKISDEEAARVLRVKEYNQKLIEQERIVKENLIGQKQLMENDQKNTEDHYKFLLQLRDELSIRKQIIDQGGLRIPQQGQDMYGEYQDMPDVGKRLFFRKSSTIGMDDMAQMLGLSGADEIFAKINAYIEEINTLWGKAVKESADMTNRAYAEMQKEIDGARESIEKLKAEYSDVVDIAQKHEKQTGVMMSKPPEQLDKYTEVYTGLGEKVDGLSKKVWDYTNAIGETVKVTQHLDKETEEVVSTTEVATENYAKQRQEVEKLANTIANMREKSAVDSKKRDRTDELKQSQAINKAMEDEIKANQSLAEVMAKAREQSAINSKKRDQSVELAQSKAINKAIEEQAIRQQQLVGSYEELKSQTLSLAELQSVLSKAYAGREIREVSLNRTTGQWTATVTDSTSQELRLKGALDQTTGSLYQQGEALKQVRNRNLGFWQEMSVALKRVPVWMTSMTLFYQTLRFFTNGVKYVSELGNALNEVAIVTGQSQAQVEKLGFEYQKLAKDMAVTTKQVTEASVTFYRQGLSQAEVMDRVRVATQFAKVANIEFAQSSEIITSATNGLGISATKAVDVMTAIADSAATSSEEMGTMLQHVSGSAGQLNIEYEKLAAWAGTISSKTRESASSIGTFLKTMLQRMINLRENGFDEEDGTKINDVAKALASVDIELVDATGNFRNLATVVDELGEIWDTLDNRTSAYIATAMSGTRQASRFLSLMGGYKESIRLYDIALDSAGTTQEKYNKYLQSTEAYLNRLNATATGVWQKVFDSNLIRGGITLITQVVEVFDWMVSTIGFIPSVAIPAALALGLFNTTIKGLLVSLGSFITAAAGSATIFSSILASVSPLGVAVAVVGALALALNSVVGSIAKAQAKMQETEEMNRQMLDSYNSQGNQIDSLVDKYTTLSSKTSLSAQQQEELRTVQNELNRLMPQLTSSVDANGDAHLRSADAIKAEIEYIKELKRLQDEQFINEFENKVERQNNAIDNLLKQIEKLSKENITIEKYMDDEGIERYREVNETIEERIKRLREKLMAEHELQEKQEERISTYAEMIYAKLNDAGATEKLTSEEQKYVDTLARAQDITGDNIFQYGEFVNKITDLIGARDVLNSAVEDSSKHLSIEQTAILNRLGLMDDEIQATGFLTDALIKLAKARLQERMSADPAIANAGRDRYVGGNYVSPYAKMVADIAELEQSLKIRDSIFGSTRDKPDKDAKDFSKQFDLSLIILKRLNAEIDELRSNLEELTDVEEKRAFIVDRLIPKYHEQKKVLSEVLKMQNSMLKDAKNKLQELVSDSDYQKIISGDYSNITIKNEEIAKAVDKFYELSSAVQSTESAIRGANSAIQKLGSDMQQLAEQETKRRENEINQWEREAEQLADQIINAYKEYYRMQKDYQDKALRDELDAETKRHNTVADNLNEELKQFEKIITARLRLIDEQADEEDYAKRLSKEQRERGEIQRQIDILQLDDSMAARAKLTELRKQLSEKDESITEMQAKREKDLRKKNLQDQLSDFKDNIDRRKTLEDQYHNAEKQRIDDLKEYWNRYYDNIINDERRWSQIKQDIMSGDQTKINTILDDINSKSRTLTTNLSSYFSSFGVVVQNLIDKLRQLSSSIPALGNKPVFEDVIDYGDYENIIAPPKQPTPPPNQDWSKEIWGQQYEVKNNGYWIYKDGRYIPAENFKYLPKEVLEEARRQKANAARFDTGGMTPYWPGNEPKWSLLDKKELVLEKNDTKNLLKSIGILRTIVPQLSNVQPNVATNNTQATLNVTVYTNGTKKDGDIVAQNIVGGLRKLGINFAR